MALLSTFHFQLLTTRPMTWRTHVTIGVNALWLAGLTGKIDSGILVLLGASILGSLLPDIDATAGGGAKIHYVGGGVLGGFQGLFFGKTFHHRGLMHSLFMVACMFLLALVGLKIFSLKYDFDTSGSLNLLPFVFALSYLSHTIIDGFNTNVGYLYPFSYKRFALLPRVLLTRVGGPMDLLLFFVGIFGLVLFAGLYLQQLYPTGVY